MPAVGPLSEGATLRGQQYDSGTDVYTRFEYDSLSLALAGLADGEPLELRVRLHNGGTRPGKEVVQVYVADLESFVPRHAARAPGLRRGTPRPRQDIERNLSQLSRERTAPCGSPPSTAHGQRHASARRAPSRSIRQPARSPTRDRASGMGHGSKLRSSGNLDDPRPR